jgi:hypothetical protein
MNIYISPVEGSRSGSLTGEDISKMEERDMAVTTEILEGVKSALGIEGDYQDATLTEYIDEVLSFLTDSGVSAQYIKVGLIARGVSDLWNYGAAGGKLSEYFIQRATQLSYKR